MPLFMPTAPSIFYFTNFLHNGRSSSIFATMRFCSASGGRGILIEASLSFEIWQMISPVARFLLHLIP